MSMPMPRKRNQPDAPRLNTRPKNQNTRPGVEAGVVGTRCTSAQVEEVRVADTAQKAAAARSQQNAIERVAAVEDEQNTRDKQYAETANHPVDPPRSSAAPSIEDDRAPESEYSNESDVYVDSGASDEEEEPMAKDRGAHLQDPTVKKEAESARIPRRAGNDSSSSSGGKKAKKKAKITKKGGLAGKPAANKKAATSALGRSTVNTNFDVPMTQYGGPAVDDDENEQLERPAPGGKGKKRGLPTNPGLKIVTPTRRPTQKELRGGSDKWTLEHLPSGTASLFMSDVVPLACENLSTLERKEGKPGVRYEVTKDSLWFGLINYRHDDWCGNFASQAERGMLLLIESSNEKQRHKEAGEEEDEDKEPTADHGPEKPCEFRFDTPKGIADFAEWALETDGKTMAFQWEQWGDGKAKKGFLFSYLIVFAYVAHQSILDSIPSKYKCSEARPYGALLMAVKAVEHNLTFWRTGTYTVPAGPAGKFSGDHWGDIRTRAPGGTIKLTCRATKFLGVLQGWDDECCERLREDASHWVETKKHRRASSSRGTSDAEDIVEIVEEDPKAEDSDDDEDFMDMEEGDEEVLGRNEDVALGDALASNSAFAFASQALQPFAELRKQSSKNLTAPHLHQAEVVGVPCWHLDGDGIGSWLARRRLEWDVGMQSACLRHLCGIGVGWWGIHASHQSAHRSEPKINRGKATCDPSSPSTSFGQPPVVGLDLQKLSWLRTVHHIRIFGEAWMGRKMEKEKGNSLRGDWRLESYYRGLCSDFVQCNLDRWENLKCGIWRYPECAYLKCGIWRYPECA
ncbi:hypothetical protein B0H10DRAFT_2193487 [Mycena sp. CBHHK59/15]|nr:hypothetical protein B0H10DRAFT_2193487 [Mycena sp. CBHHK59/15]